MISGQNKTFVIQLDALNVFMIVMDAKNQIQWQGFDIQQ